MKTALVLSGGGVAGAIEAGAMHEVLKTIKPDFVVGSSVGAINGALYCSGNSTNDLINIWNRTSRRSVLPINLKLFYKLHKAESIFSNKGLVRLLKKELKTETFEDCHTPLYVAATELLTGKEHYFNSGLLIPALLSSSAIPPLLPPQKIGKKYFVDGSLTNYIGTKKALELGAKRIIVINARYSDNMKKIQNLVQLSHHAFRLLRFQVLKEELDICKNVELIEIHSSISAKNIIRFNDVAEYIKEGSASAKKVMRKLNV